ncbi:MAG: hypothetical protein P4L67_02910, partial [Candidatus Pacebacteria bacterium]|nr:hypothetical protein [Candidatus Paceibacterota bacterium]
MSNELVDPFSPEFSIKYYARRYHDPQAIETSRYDQRPSLNWAVGIRDRNRTNPREEFDAILNLYPHWTFGTRPSLNCIPTSLSLLARPDSLLEDYNISAQFADSEDKNSNDYREQIAAFIRDMADRRGVHQEAFDRLSEIFAVNTRVDVEERRTVMKERAARFAKTETACAEDFYEVSALMDGRWLQQCTYGFPDDAASRTTELRSDADLAHGLLISHSWRTYNPLGMFNMGLFPHANLEHDPIAGRSSFLHYMRSPPVDGLGSAGIGHVQPLFPAPQYFGSDLNSPLNEFEPTVWIPTLYHRDPHLHFVPSLTTRSPSHGERHVRIGSLVRLHNDDSEPEPNDVYLVFATLIKQSNNSLRQYREALLRSIDNDLDRTAKETQFLLIDEFEREHHYLYAPGGLVALFHVGATSSLAEIRTMLTTLTEGEVSIRFKMRSFSDIMQVVKPSDWETLPKNERQVLMSVEASEKHGTTITQLDTHQIPPLPIPEVLFKSLYIWIRDSLAPSLQSELGLVTSIDPAGVTELQKARAEEELFEHIDNYGVEKFFENFLKSVRDHSQDPFDPQALLILRQCFGDHCVTDGWIKHFAGPLLAWTSGPGERTIEFAPEHPNRARERRRREKAA